MYNIRQLAILSALMCLLAASAYAAQMSVEPAYQEVFKGDTITVNITVDPEESGVYAASYTLHFNNTLLYATVQTRGPFLRQDGENSNVYGNVTDNPNGKVEYGECRVGDVSGVNDSGVLATITFQVIGVEGTSSLGISDYIGELLYSNSPPPYGSSIPTNVNNGSVGVKGICGDVNGDGLVMTGDGVRILENQTFVGNPDYFIDNLRAADVNGDGLVMTGDGVRILENQTFVGNPDYFLNCC
jgi:hypothetical protein